MASYTVINCTTNNLHIVVPWNGGSMALTIPSSGAINLLPYAGSIEACKLIPGIRDWELRGIIAVRAIP